MVKLKAYIKKFKALPAKRKLVVVIAALAVLVILFLGKSLVIAAFVNGRPISRFSVIKQLESQGGGEVLDNLIEKSLISQEAGKQGVKISTEAVDEEISRIEDILTEQNLTLDAALEARGETKASLIEQIRLQKIIEAILGDKITVSEDEEKAYFEENKDLYGEETKFEEVKDSIGEQLFQNKLSEEYTKWIEELRSKANIVYLLKYL